MNGRIARELKVTVLQVGCRFGLGGPDDWPVAVEKDASEFARGDISTLLGVGDREGAVWSNGEVEFVYERKEGCEAAGAGGDVEVGFHVGFEAAEGVGDSWLEKEDQSVLLLRTRHDIKLTSPSNEGPNDDAMNALISHSRVGRPRLGVAWVVVTSAAIDGALEGDPKTVVFPDEGAGEGRGSRGCSSRG